MFTGLIQEIGVIERVNTGPMTDLWIRSAFPVDELVLGESVSFDGACLTVVEKGQGTFKVQAAAETLRRTTLGDWRVGTRVNLERALRMGDRLGGHLVLGHVDGVTQVVDRKAEGGSWVMGFALPQGLAPFFIEKGSVTLDGVSLTVNELDAHRFSVQLIPETQARTTLAQKQVGSKVNVEADVIGKYVARLYGQRQGGGLTEQTLRLAGFGSDKA